MIDDIEDPETAAVDESGPARQSGLTNERFVLQLMRYSRHGALMQAFVLQALAEFARQVARASDDDLCGDGAIVRPLAWRGCAVELLAVYEANYSCLA